MEASTIDAVPVASIGRVALYNTRLSSMTSMTSMTPTRSSLYQQSVNSASSPSSTAPTAASVLSSAAVVGVTVATAVVAAVRCKLKAVRECSCCQGYGVERCKLCSGKGTIQWEGKMAHREPCPMCLGRRLVKCSACGGGIMFSRSLFTHKANKGEEALMETLTTLTAPSRLFGRRAGNEQEEARIAESEEFSKEILTDGWSKRL